ncbi:MAG: signal peptidase II [Treponema sp.]|jgi:signal peptidase II|nr:signal peptidase II [Treponema sp.]
MKLNKEKFLPLLLTGIIIIVDQCSKSFIASKWPVGSMIKDVFNNDFLQIIHVRNKVIAFSMGQNLPDPVKPALFIALPLLVLAVLLWYYFKSNEFTNTQRWAIAGIIGGGIGNLIDRIIRPEGVVDFISIKFYGFLGFDRWPTFNLADSSVVVCCLLLFATILFNIKKTKEGQPNEQKS